MDVSAEGRHEEERQREGKVNKSREDLRKRLTRLRGKQRRQNEDRKNRCRRKRKKEDDR